MSLFVEIMQVYVGSNGTTTKALYERLEAHGAAGVIAVNLFRSCKNSERAKIYRRGSSRRAAYDTKQWAMDNLDAALLAHAEACGIAWGWAEDRAQPFHKWVLYVDLPAGQVSFHTAARGKGPDYPGEWDRTREQGPTRICRFIVQLLSAKECEHASADTGRRAETASPRHCGEPAAPRIAS